MQRPVGIKEVAEEAGVSLTTVSHSLNGKGRVHERTRRHVQEVAARLGYKPNAVARSLAGGRSGLIGLAVAQTLDGQFAVSDFAYYAQLMSAATAAAFDSGYALVLASGGEEGAWSSVRLDGLIVVDPVRDDPLCASFRSRGVPVVTTGRVPGGKDGFWIDNDHIAGTHAILDHLASRGAQRIALLASPPVTSYAIDARDAYEEWCGERRQDSIVAVARDDLTEGSGFEATAKLLRRVKPPDAVYATLDRLALGGLLAAHANGLTVPRDLLVAGCTDSEAGKLARPSLTALALNPEEIGRESVAMVTELIEGRRPQSSHVLVPTRVIPRSSTRRRGSSPRGEERDGRRASSGAAAGERAEAKSAPALRGHQRSPRRSSRSAQMSR